jgi:hypothetical protein
MSGDYDSYIVYGWRELKDDRVIDRKWLKLQYETFSLGATDVREYYGNAVCGIICTFNNATGIVDIMEKDKSLVQDLYTKVKNYESGEVSPIGFYTCIIGDLSWHEHEEYVPHLDYVHDD